MRRIRASTTLPIASGERVHVLSEFLPLFEEGLLDVVQADLTHFGGFTGMRKLAACADAYGLPLAPHNVCGPVGTAANVHFAVATPNYKVLEHFNDFADPWVFDLVGIFHAADPKLKSRENVMFFNMSYFDEATGFGSGSVGWSYNSGGHQRAFYLSFSAASLASGLLPPAGNGNELPPLPGAPSTYASAAYGVNRFGQVVGWAQNNSGASRAFLYTPTGGMIDLNTLLPGGSLWVLTSARAINDAVIIVGTGTYGESTQHVSWILYPTCQE